MWALHTECLCTFLLILAEKKATEGSYKGQIGTVYEQELMLLPNEVHCSYHHSFIFLFFFFVS